MAKSSRWWQPDPDHEIQPWALLVLMLALPLLLAFALVLATLNSVGGYGFSLWPKDDDVA